MIKGIIAPNLTFFKENGSMDEDKCRWHMDWVLSSGVDGLFVTGTYGSGYLMNLDERVKMYEMAKEVSDKYPGTFVIAHVGCSDTGSSVYLTRAAERCGASAVSAIAPYNYKYTEDELLNYYSEIARASGIPVFAYNNPEITGSALSYKLITRLEAAGIAGLKDSSVNIGLFTSIYNSCKVNNSEFKYISGTTTGWLTFQKMGADTMIAGMCNYLPEAVEALYRYSLTDPEKAIKVYEICSGLSSKIKQGNSVASSHIALKARGFDPGYTRLPLTVSYEDKMEKISVISRYITGALSEISSLEAK